MLSFRRQSLQTLLEEKIILKSNKINSSEHQSYTDLARPKARKCDILPARFQCSVYFKIILTNVPWYSLCLNHPKSTILSHLRVFLITSRNRHTNNPESGGEKSPEGS